MRGAEASNGLPSKGRLTTNKLGGDEGGRDSGVRNGRVSRGEGVDVDGATNVKVAPLAGEGEGSKGEQRVAPQWEVGHCSIEAATVR